MSDSKKRPHEAGTEVQTRSSDETAPVAKKMKMAEEPAKQTENASLPQEVRLKSLLIVKDRLPAYAASTDPGTRYGTLNQDCYFMDRLTQPNGNHVTIIGVFDGHGKHGERASQLASEVFQRSLKAHLMQSRHVSMREHEKAMRNIFEAAHKRIISEYEALTTLELDGYKFSLKVTADRVDFYSAPDCPYVLLQDFGTTAVLCIYWEETQKLMVANCGDSDALIGRWDGASGQLQPNLLAVSDNVACTTNGEQERIRREHGKKTKFGGGYLSPNDGTYGFHSLAMTRALGHKFLEKYGVTWDPHIRLFQITAEDVVLVVASDGLFDVVNSKAVLSMAAEKNQIDGELRTLTPSESSHSLVHLALGNWKKQFNAGDVADNTTVVVLKLSSQFDGEVPERDELAASGTTFSPAHVVFHAFETEIEETPRDTLEGNDAQSSDTPVLPSDDAAQDSNATNGQHSTANGESSHGKDAGTNGSEQATSKTDESVSPSTASDQTLASSTSNSGDDESVKVPSIALPPQEGDADEAQAADASTGTAEGSRKGKSSAEPDESTSAQQSSHADASSTAAGESKSTSGSSVDGASNSN